MFSERTFLDGYWTLDILRGLLIEEINNLKNANKLNQDLQFELDT